MINTNFRKIELLKKSANQTMARQEASYQVPIQSDIKAKTFKNQEYAEPTYTQTMSKPTIARDKPFENDIPIKIKSKEREDWQLLIHFKISTVVKAKHSDATLLLELTCEEDPFFLYIFECDETDFYQLKSDQFLKVDFQKFPQMLEQLLKCCLEDIKGEKEYCCQLNIGEECILSIVENNLYRQLIHLSLKLKPGNDENVKKFLAEQLTAFKSENENLKKQLQSTKEKLSESGELNSNIEAELISQREKCKTIEEKMKYEQRSTIDELSKTSKLELDKATKDYEEEKRQMLQEKLKTIEKLSNDLTQKKSECTTLSSKNIELEKSQIELIHNLDKAKDELSYYKQDLESLKSTSKVLDTTKSSQEKTITELQLQLQSLTKQLQDKEDIVGKSSNLIDSSNAQRKQLEELISILKSNASKMEDKLQSSAQEIIKGNSIIAKLQEDIKSQKQKIKLKNSELLQQETVISQQKSKIDEICKEMDNTRRDVERKEDQINKLKSLAEEQNRKIIEEAKLIKSSEQMIQYLNTQINEAKKPNRPPNIPMSTSKSYLPQNYKPAYSTVESIMESVGKNQNEYLGSTAKVANEIKDYRYSPMPVQTVMEKPNYIFEKIGESQTAEKPLSLTDLHKDDDNILPIKYTKPTGV